MQGVVPGVAAAPRLKIGGGIVAGGGELRQRQGIRAIGQELEVFLVGSALERDLKAQRLPPHLLKLAGQGGLTAAAVIQQRDRAQLLHGGGAGVARLVQLRGGLGAAVAVALRVVVDKRTVGIAEVLPLAGADAAGDQPVSGHIAAAQVGGQRVSVDGQAQGAAQAVPLQIGGHSVDHQQTHRRVAAVAGRLIGRADDHIHTARVDAGLLLRLEHQLHPVGHDALGIVVVILLLQCQTVVIRPVAAPTERAVAHKVGAAVRPVLIALHRRLLHRHGGRGGTHAAEEVGARAAERYLEGVLLRGADLQRLAVAGAGLVIAGDYGQNVRAGAGGVRRDKALPGVDEILRRQAAAVGPHRVAAEAEGVRHRAVLVVRLLPGLGHGGHGLFAVPAQQIVKQVEHHGALRRRGGQGGVHGVEQAGHHHRQLLLVVGVFVTAGQQSGGQAQGQQKRQKAVYPFHTVLPGNKLSPL